MKKFFELLYFGAYYIDLQVDRLCRRFTNPCVALFIYVLSYISPGPKRKMAEQGITIEQHIKETLDKCDKLSESNMDFSYTFFIYPMLMTFYTFMYFDLMLILRMIFGNDWGIIQINITNANIIMGVIFVLAGLSTAKMKSIVGQDKTVKKYRRKSKSVHRKALALFLGCCALVLLGFYFLFLKR